MNQTSSKFNKLNQKGEKDEDEDQQTVGDSKPEVFFIGQITGGIDFECEDGLFCEMLPDAGQNWELLEPINTKTYVTQTSYTEPGQMFVWNHPIDLHFQVNDLAGWPKGVFKIWRLDSTNKIDIISYGVCPFPRTQGYHQLICETWSPLGNWKFGTLAFYLGNQPQLMGAQSVASNISQDIVDSTKEISRSKLLGVSNGKILLEIECVLRNFDILNVTGQEPRQLQPTTLLND